MRGRQRNVMAMATVAALALGACGDADDGAMDEPATQSRTETPGPQAEPAQVAADLPDGVTQEQYQQGQQLFTGQGGCHACHGPQGAGTQLGPDLTDSEWLNIDSRDYEAIVEVITTGVPSPVEAPAPMPPMGGASLSQDQVHALAAYVYGISEG